MYQTITKSDFRQAFADMDADGKCPFSYDGLGVLYDYLEETGYGELDVIELCCNFTEYESIEDFQKDYGKEYQILSDIEWKTIVLPIDYERFIVMTF